MLVVNPDTEKGGEWLEPKGSADARPCADRAGGQLPSLQAANPTPLPWHLDPYLMPPWTQFMFEGSQLSFSRANFYFSGKNKQKIIKSLSTFPAPVKSCYFFKLLGSNLAPFAFEVSAGIHVQPTWHLAVFRSPHTLVWLVPVPAGLFA